VFPTNTFNEIFTEQDLDALAHGTGGEPQYDRIRVNAGMPLAAWLLDVGTTMSTTSLTPMPRKENEEIIAGQVSYTFTIQTNIGIDVRNTISTSLWTSLGGEVSGGFQHTGTMTLILNGLDSVTTAGVKSGNTIRVLSKPLKPTAVSFLLYCPLPQIGELLGPGYQTGKYCFWPQHAAASRIAANIPKKRFKPESEVVRPFPRQTETKEFVPEAQRSPPDANRPKPLIRPSVPPQATAPASRPFIDQPHGTILYPEPLSPLGR
jgi:hypothetical protein